MASVFLDANVFIDAMEERREVDIEDFAGYSLVVSPVSVATLAYLYKYKIPEEKLSTQLSFYNFAELNERLVHFASEGPTADFEDNLQLHTAAAAECDLFLTRDEELLKLKFFGKMRILSAMPKRE